MCDATATNREHVPCRGIFPAEDKYRKNLTKVPSCDAHNLRKSKDDELLRHILACAPGNNELALKVVERVIPALDRRPHIMETFLPDLAAVQIGNFKSASFTIDVPRFESSIKAIVRGLFFSDTRSKLLGDLTVVWGALLTSDRSEAPFFDFIRNAERRYPPMKRGSNPRVFRYDFHYANFESPGLCRLRFYEGHPIYVAWKKGLIT